MTKLPLYLSFLALSLTTQAQQPAIFHETWSENPVIHTIDSRYNKESAVILLDTRRIEYVDLPNNKAAKYRTVHRIVHLLDDKGIESFNKLQIGYTDTSDIIDLRARAILPDGTVREVSKTDMKDTKDEDGRSYRIFALEGLEKGAEVEFTYTIKVNLNFFGEEYLQGSWPTLDAHLEVLSPDSLVFQLRGYNCNATISDTSISGKKVVFTRLTDIPGAEKEKYAAYDANLRRVEYRLSYNYSSGTDHVRLNTWNVLAQRIHSIYEVFSEKDLKRVGEIIGANGWQSLPDDKQKIIAVENYLKNQFVTRGDIDEENADNIEWMLKNRIASTKGLIRLYGAIFSKLGVEHQIVLTCDRNEKSIDKSFENWNNAGNFLFYFPTTKKFIAPTLAYMRYPWINPSWAATDAVFCQSTTIGTYTTAIAVVKRVPLEDFSETFSRLDATIGFNSRLDSLRVDFTETDGGYLAVTSRAIYSRGDPEDRRKMLKAIARLATNSEKLLSSNVENDKIEDCNDNKPFILQEHILTDGLLENAGRNMLVKLGQIIGPQTEMYQEKPRQFPVSIEYPHTLERFIDFVIPPGYTIRNPGDVAIQQDFKTDGVTTLGFVSSYKMEGDTLHIHVLETYREPVYPLSEYENFKKVINAAADFNKVTLVLIPK